jgi:hypothetical protein
MKLKRTLLIVLLVLFTATATLNSTVLADDNDIVCVSC